MTDIEMTRGDSATFDVAVTRYNAATHVNDLVTPDKAWFTAKANARDSDDSAVVALNSEDQPEQVLITTGSIRIKLDPEDTAEYLQRWLVYDVQILESDGTITTIEKGKMQLSADVTLATS